MRVKVTVVFTETATIDIGDLKPNLIRQLLEENDGALAKDWGLYDVATVERTIESVDVAETKAKA